VSTYKGLVWKTMYERIVAGLGLDPTVALPTSMQTRVVEAVNEQVRVAIESEWWPEFLKVEQREYRATWAVGTTYASGAEVYCEDSDGVGGYYVSQAGSNTGHDPTTDSGAWWAAVGDDFLRTIDFEQTGETEIGGVDTTYCVFDRDPRIYRNAGVVRDVVLEQRALLVNAETAPTQPWVRFRLLAPEFTLTVWSSGTTYAKGDLVYVAATGHTYKGLQASSNKAPATETAHWEIVWFPKTFSRFVRASVLARMLGDEEARARAKAEADEEMERLMDAVVEAQDGGREARFSR
jgi:hypothetical protein